MAHLKDLYTLGLELIARVCAGIISNHLVVKYFCLPFLLVPAAHPGICDFPIYKTILTVYALDGGCQLNQPLLAVTVRSSLYLPVFA